MKKIAIESKIREVSEKCKDRRVWVVKSTLMVCGYVFDYAVRLVCADHVVAGFINYLDVWLD